MDAHLSRPGWRGEDLGLSTVQGTLTASDWRGRGRGKWEAGRRQKFFFSIKKIPKPPRLLTWLQVALHDPTATLIAEDNIETTH